MPRHRTEPLTPIRSARADYSVVLITNGTDAETVAFIRTARFLGAAHIFVYFDRPFEASVFNRFDGLSLLDAAELHEGAPRPIFVDLQKQAYRDAYARCTTTWLAVCDNDEMIFHPRLPMAKFLKRVPDDCTHIHAPVVEAFWSSGRDVHTMFSATHVRRPYKTKQNEVVRSAIYGDATLFTTKRCTVGHARGKYLVRTGLDLKPDTHEPHANGKDEVVPLKKRLPLVLHYDAISYDIWFKKFGSGLGLAEGTKVTRNREALVSSLSTERSGTANRQIFDKLFVWPRQVRDRFGRRRLRSLSPKWGALFNTGSVNWWGLRRYGLRRAFNRLIARN